MLLSWQHLVTNTFRPPAPFTIVTWFFHLIIGHFQNFHFLNISWTESHYTVKGHFGKVFREARIITVTPHGNLINIFVLQYIFWRDKYPRIAFESNFWKIIKSLRVWNSVYWDLRWRPMAFSAFIWADGTRPIWNLIVGSSGFVFSSQPGHFVNFWWRSISTS